MEFTARDLANMFNFNVARVKRWARLFFGTDEIAGQQMGLQRKFSLNEAFLLYIGGVLVSELQIPVKEIAKILEDLQPWLEKKGLLPDMPSTAFDPNTEIPWTGWNIHIQRGDPCYICRASVDLAERHVRTPGGRRVLKRVYHTEHITRLPKGGVKHSAYIAAMEVSISHILQLFMMQTVGKKAWGQWARSRPDGKHVKLSDVP